MITCHLQGGLCNQLFQIFAVMAYCVRHNIKCVFSYTDMLYTGKPRRTYWENFLVSLKVFTTHNSFYRLKNEDLNYFHLVELPLHEYQEIPNLNSTENYMLKGYFQSYRYFEKEQDMIFSLVRLDTQLYDIRQEFNYLFTKKYTISMHFRLGDYKFLQEYHNLLPYEYYEKSIYHILSKLGAEEYENIQILYFCEEEDNEHVDSTVENLKKHFQTKGFPLSFLKVQDSIEDWKQMLIMACCDHNIIANSSFSWWGAYFNKNKDKIVCYPSQWFGPRLMHNYMGDMFPTSWNKIISS